MAELAHNLARHIAGIDVGSNAIRLVIAQVSSQGALTVVETKRVPVRLGRRVFSDGEMDGETVARAAQAFQDFRHLMEHHHVQGFRAVATSACREAGDQREFLLRIESETGIKVEVIDAAEEARLIHLAVAAALKDSFPPRMILDIGGGSLELSLVGKSGIMESTTLPIGTVRLMERHALYGAIEPSAAERLRKEVSAILDQSPAAGWKQVRSRVVATGGNAEELARLAPGTPQRGMGTLSLRSLEALIPKILERDVAERMNAFGFRQDRSEVIGVAALILSTIGRRLGVNRFLVPGVGVREGILSDLTAAGIPALGSESGLTLSSARNFAERSGCSSRHFEHVRRLSLSLFDQLQGIHGLGGEMRQLLELGAILHDVGHFIQQQLGVQVTLQVNQTPLVLAQGR